jgi:PST family polysaccharide transporter
MSNHSSALEVAQVEIGPDFQPPSLEATVNVSPTAPVESTSSMDHVLLRAIAWTGAGKWATQLLTWASTIVAARLLSPSDYGVMGMATMYLGFINLVSEFGLGQSVITLRFLSGQQIAQINSISLLLGCGFFLFSSVTATFVGHFFHSPQLPAVIMVMGIGFLISGFQVVPDALLQRDLKFKRIASFDTVRALTQSLLTVTLAWLGFGYWSLAFGNLSGTIIYTLLVVASKRHWFALPSLREIKTSLSFSADVLGSRVAWYSYSNSDFLVAGRVLGEASLGAYTLAWTMASTPVEKIANMVMKVTPAFFSAVQHDKAQLRRYLLGITEGLSLLCFPASIGLALVADQFVLAVLGPRWVNATTPLRLLALYAALRSITTLLPVLLNALQRSRFVMWNTVVAAAVFPVAFYLTSRWGTAGIAAAWIVLYPCISAPLIWRTRRELDLPLGRYLASMLPALRACLVMAIAVCGVRAITPAQWPILSRLLISAAAGAITYGIFVLMVEKQRVRSAYALVRGACS